MVIVYSCPNAAVNFVIDKTPNIIISLKFCNYFKRVVTKDCPFQRNQFNTYLINNVTTPYLDFYIPFFIDTE